MQYQTVLDTVDRLDHAVDLRRADADSLPVQRGIRAPGNHAAHPVGREADQIALAPLARIHFEIGGAIPLETGIVPEVQRHRRNRPGDDQLTLAVKQPVSPLVPGLGGDTQARRLNLAGVNRQYRHSTDESGRDVRAPANRHQVQIGGHMSVYPLEDLNRRR